MIRIRDGRPGFVLVEGDGIGAADGRVLAETARLLELAAKRSYFGSAVLVDQYRIGLLGRLRCSSLVAMRVRRSAG